MSALSTSDWLRIVGTTATIVSGIIGLAAIFQKIQDRHRQSEDGRPQIKTTINRSYYHGGWRSVQLHLIPRDENANFRYNDWRIQEVVLLKPSDAMLCRAQDDDCASGVFFPDAPVRALAGRPDGRPQRFALEFYIKFRDERRVRAAKLRVTYSKTTGGSRRTETVTAALPADAEAPR